VNRRFQYGDGINPQRRRKQALPGCSSPRGRFLSALDIPGEFAKQFLELIKFLARQWVNRGVPRALAFVGKMP
jgi:hypothetical protein